MNPTNEEIIKNFLKQIATQDNRGTALPYFYVIRTEVEDSAPLENCDETKVYWNDQSFDSMEDLEKDLTENGYDEEAIKEAMNEACEYGIKKRWDERNMFLTEQDAENHLIANNYHYSHNAHTYVKHAWRAPHLAEFMKALTEHFGV